jgi:hypothetical protein
MNTSVSLSQGVVISMRRSAAAGIRSERSHYQSA